MTGVMGRFSRWFGSGKRSGASGPKIGVFGKHPGWGDHIEKLGTWSAEIEVIRQSLYVNGIQKALPTWMSLADEDRVNGFDHRFAWRLRDVSVIGRIWSSRDARDRQHYPLIGMIAVDSARPALVARVLEGPLDRLEAGLRDTETSDGVKAVVDDAQADAARIWKSSGRQATEGDGASPFNAVISRIDDELAWRRIRHEAQVKLEGFGRRGGSTSTMIPPKNMRPQHLRLPRLARDDTEELVLWSEFWEAICAHGVHFAVFARASSEVTDTIVGDAIDADFAFLQKSESALPDAAMIEYELDHQDEGWLVDLLAHADNTS